MEEDVQGTATVCYKSSEQDDRVNRQQINLPAITKWAIIQRKVKCLIV